MRVGSIAAFALSVSMAFALGMWAQDQRVHDRYFREGQNDANYDAIFDGYWLYLGCLSDDCAHEKRASDFIVKRGEWRLRYGKAPKLTPEHDAFRSMDKQ